MLILLIKQGRDACTLYTELVHKLTVNSPVLGSNPTCTVCSKSMGEDISGLSFPETEGRGRRESRKGGRGEEGGGEGRVGRKGGGEGRVRRESRK